MANSLTGKKSVPPIFSTFKADPSAPAFSVPIADRPPLTITQWVHLATFNLYFFCSLVFLHPLQLFAFPVYFHPKTRVYWDDFADWCKDLFARVLVLLSQIWAPTVIRLSVDDDAADLLNLDKIVQRDSRGVVTGLDLPDRMVVTSNHQVYCDWTYIWNLLYLAKLQTSVIIMLKASLQWTPLFGPAMQAFRFIFMHRNWNKDQTALGSALEDIAARAGRSLKPFVLLVFPEGTLVSPLTRPISQKYAAKASIADCRNELLPRSTGLLFCLRALSPRVPNLRLLDITIGYPGIPAGKYGQDYYTLQSIYGHSTPPPTVHMHLRMYNVKVDVPIGTQAVDERASREETTSAAINSTAEEKKEFDDWLLQRWREKDDMLDNFVNTGSLVSGRRFIDVPIQLRTTRELCTLLLMTIFGAWLSKVVFSALWRLAWAAILHFLRK